MPLRRRLIKLGHSRAVVIPQAWLKYHEDRVGRPVEEILMELNGAITLTVEGKGEKAEKQPVAMGVPQHATSPIKAQAKKAPRLSANFNPRAAVMKEAPRILEELELSNDGRLMVREDKVNKQYILYDPETKKFYAEPVKKPKRRSSQK